MNLTETKEAIARLQTAWKFYFGDLNYLVEPPQRQFQVWLTLYGEIPTQEGFARGNCWLQKTQRRLSLDDLVRYCSACAKNFKQEAANVDSKPASH